MLYINQDIAWLQEEEKCSASRIFKELSSSHVTRRRTHWTALSQTTSSHPRRRLFHSPTQNFPPFARLSFFVGAALCNQESSKWSRHNVFTSPSFITRKSWSWPWSWDKSPYILKAGFAGWKIHKLLRIFSTKMPFWHKRNKLHKGGFSLATKRPRKQQSIVRHLIMSNFKVMTDILQSPSYRSTPETQCAKWMCGTLIFIPCIGPKIVGF